MHRERAIGAQGLDANRSPVWRQGDSAESGRLRFLLYVRIPVQVRHQFQNQWGTIPFGVGHLTEDRETVLGIEHPRPRRLRETKRCSLPHSERNQSPTSPEYATYTGTVSAISAPGSFPARYATGYLGDIGVPVVLPMDFSAWFEVYLGDRWWTFDARNNQPRIGRVLMATGRDAADVALTTSFGGSWLNRFSVVSDEVIEAVSPYTTMSAA